MHSISISLLILDNHVYGALDKLKSVDSGEDDNYFELAESSIPNAYEPQTYNEVASPNKQVYVRFVFINHSLIYSWWPWSSRRSVYTYSRFLITQNLTKIGHLPSFKFKSPVHEQN